ncbi:hypothetical protein Tco_1012944, partial [Tanacetum coccineum]
ILNFREGDITFRDRVFTKKIGEYVKNIDLLSLIEDEERSAIDGVFLRMVENLEVWNDFPWGEHIWRELYAAIRNVNSNHKETHHKSLEMNPNFVLTYSVSRFVLCFKIWILESSFVTDCWWSKLSEEILRGRFWSKHLAFKKWEYFRLLLLKKDSNLKHKCDLGDKYWRDEDGGPNPTSNKDDVNVLVEFLDDLVDEKCGTNKRRYVNVLRPPMEVDTYVKGPIMDTLRKLNNALDEEMIERCQDLKPWQEDLNRPSKCIVKIYRNYYLEQFLISSGWRHCKFPWCNEIFMDRPFWDSLIGLDDNR